MHSYSNYINLVEKTLVEQWNLPKPTDVNDDDFRTGVSLITKIAVHSVNKQLSKESTSEIKISLGAPEFSQKVKEYAQKRAMTIKKILETDFPFSILKFSIFTESTLRHVLKHNENECNEVLLDKLFDKGLNDLKTSEIEKACFLLKNAYLKKNDNRAGYYLLLLLQKKSGCDYEIPEKDSFNHSTVNEVLSRFFAGNVNVNDPKSFLEILLYQSARLDKTLVQEFLDQNGFDGFCKFAVNYLQSAQEDLSAKQFVILKILDVCDGKLNFSDALISSNDPTLSEIGTHTSAAFHAHSLMEAIPHFKALTKSLPSFNSVNAEIIFGRPFVKLRVHEYISKNDPTFAKRVCFSFDEMFTFDSFIIGLYQSPIAEIPTYLLAYDTTTEEMVWGIPMSPTLLEIPSLNLYGVRTHFESLIAKQYLLQRFGNCLSLQFSGNKNYFISPETGGVTKLKMPSTSRNPLIGPKIDPEGFAYRFIHPTLYGGKIIDSKWEIDYEIDLKLSGRFQSFSSHCGFFSNDNQLTFIGSTGASVIIENCLAAEARNGKLYIIRKDNLENCFLDVRNLESNNDVISEAKQIIPINKTDVSFGEFCDNEQLILFSKSLDYTLPIYVNLSTKVVTFCEQSFFQSKQTINTKTGKIWIWERDSTKVWKVSSSSLELMGTLNCDQNAALMYDDKSQTLYFTNL